MRRFMTQLSWRLALSQEQLFAIERSRPKTIPPINKSHQMFFKYVLTLPQLLLLTFVALIWISNFYLHAKGSTAQPQSTCVNQWATEGYVPCSRVSVVVVVGEWWLIHSLCQDKWISCCCFLLHAFWSIVGYGIPINNSSSNDYTCNSVEYSKPLHTHTGVVKFMLPE